MLVYDSRTGGLTLDGCYEGRGYSGTGEGRDNPELEWKPQTGPIPRGRYSIGPAYDHPHLGLITFNLEPVGHNACGRSLFRIHGNNAANDASHGCIVAGRTIRERIRDDNETELEVIASPAEEPEPPQVKPLHKSRTIAAQAGATAATASAGIIESIQQAQSQVSQLTPYLEWAKWIMIGLIVASIIVTVFARVDDHRKARR